jgi:glc operon protein GlcG
MMPPRYGPPITLGQARVVMAAAEAEALANDWPMVVAIVGSGGQLVMLHALDHTQHGSVPVAQGKAETAVNFRRPSKLFEDAVASGSLGLRLLGMHNLLPLDGGLPLIIDGCVIGAIGVSGMQSTQDAQVAAAGVAALATAGSGSR